MVDVSEAGSMAASPAPTWGDGEEDEEGGSLAGEITAMLKFRQNRKKSKDEGQVCVSVHYTHMPASTYDIATRGSKLTLQL